MKTILTSAICGFLGGVLAVVVAIGILTGFGAAPDMVSIQVKPAPVEMKGLVLLESAPRPSGIYVRYRNDGSITCGSVSFGVRAYREKKLWQSWDAWDYAEVSSGSEREAIIHPFPPNDGDLPDFSVYELKVELITGYKKD